MKKVSLIFSSLFFISLLLAGFLFRLPIVHADATSDASAATRKNFITPTLNVEIPGLKLTDAISGPCSNDPAQTCIQSSFIAQYIKGMYAWMIGAAVTIAIVMIMIGGLQYTLGAGGGEAGKGKQRIINGISGLILLICTYLILNTVNPQLSLLKMVELQNVKEFALPETASGPVGTAKEIKNTTYDDMMKKFADCVGVNYKVYKGMAWGESRLNPSIKNTHCVSVNSDPTKNCATGLFQTYGSYCRASRAFAKTGWDQYCETPGITNAAVNMALVTASLFQSSSNYIRKHCPSASAQDQVLLTYYFNWVPANMRRTVENYGCNSAAWPDKSIAEHFATRMPTIMGQGIDSYFVEKHNPSICPFDTGAKPSDFPN